MDEQINITTMNKEQLEALAYRLVKQLNNVQQNLNIVEQEIQKRPSELSEAIADETADVEE